MIFERKDKAFWEFELRMALPPPPPPAERNVPALWTRARDMFAALMKHVTSLTRLAVRPQLRRPDRHEILKRLIPIEKLTRFLLTVEAVTFLLTTPEGARLRSRVTPAQPEPIRAKAPSRLMPAPGWHTIAAAHPRVDPRIAENAERARLAAEAAAAAARQGDEEAYDEDGSLDAYVACAKPENWACSFHTRIDIDPCTDEEWRAPASWRPFALDLLADDAYFPRLREQKPVREVAHCPEQDNSLLGPGAALARRIEALSRILNNPDAAIRRIARRLAALPRDDLWPCEPAWLSDRWWLPARRDLLNAAEMFCRALQCLWYSRATPPPEPG